MRPPQRAVVLSDLTDQPLDLPAHVAAVSGASSGAVVTFSGVVRDHDGGRSVSRIEYVAHPTARRILAEVATDVAGRGDAEAVALSHRTGELAIGEAALIVAVAGAHRGEAFATAMAIVDEVKLRLPVWKRQIFTDGTDEWVGSA